jgi:prepilin-type N-terminal cleavage/methylation domain-containing protein
MQTSLFTRAFEINLHYLCSFGVLALHDDPEFSAMNVRPHVSATESGFTLIELLVGVGIVGLLSSIVIVAINPSQQLEDAAEARRMLDARTLEKAMTQFIIDTWDDSKLMTQSVSPAEGSANAVPICKQGADNASCVSLDSLVSAYLAAIPADQTYTHDTYSGYCVYLSAARFQVFPLHDMPEGASCAGQN